MDRLCLALLLLLLGPAAANAQSRAEGPWWPHPEWGAADQAGASNRITPATVLAAMQLVRTGRTYELGHVYEASMPLVGTRTFGMKMLATGSSMGENRVVYNDEMLSAEIGQVGTQFDGLGHVGAAVDYADGSSQLVFYNGFNSQEMDDKGGLRQLGIEHVRPIVTRGILVDVAGYKGVSRLEGGYEVTLEDVLGALDRQGVDADSIAPGDAVLFRYGWAQLWNDHAAYGGASPGIGFAVSNWLIEKQIAVTGSDTSVTEVSPNPDASLVIPIHQELMMKNGIFNIENMDFEELAADEGWEFLLLANPIRFKGATGSPLRPLAIR
jgi:kynurenine formamidase